ncbi:MAG: hypothetical protein V1747_08990 [Candidatus Omnitrophota bacterium]
MEKIKNILSKLSNKKTEREKAQAMVVSFIYVSVIGLIAVYMMAYAHNLHNVVVREIKHSMSFYAGESALIRAMSALHTGVAFPATMAGMTPMTVTIAQAAAGGGTTRITATVNW